MTYLLLPLTMRKIWRTSNTAWKYFLNGLDKRLILQSQLLYSTKIPHIALKDAWPIP